MKNPKNNFGFGAIGVVIVILVLAVVGMAGYIVWDRTNDNEVVTNLKMADNNMPTSESTDGSSSKTSVAPKSYATAEERDQNRKQDLDAIVAELNAFSKLKKRYPTQDEFLSSKWRDDNGFSLTLEQVQDPLSTGGEESLVAYEIGKDGMGTLNYKPVIGQYVYNPTDGVGNTCKNQQSSLGYGGVKATIDSCTSFTLNITTEKYFDATRQMYTYYASSF